MRCGGARVSELVYVETGSRTLKRRCEDGVQEEEDCKKDDNDNILARRKQSSQWYLPPGRTAHMICAAR